MRVLVGLMFVATILATATGSGASVPSRTEVVRWSPFDSAGRVKQSLSIEVVKGGGCWDIGYTYVGGIGYRCGSGNVLFNDCFRDGPDPTDYVVCIGRPWQTTAWRIRSPHLLLYPGVTFTAAADYPWGIVLGDGNRCGVVQGAHDVVRTHGRIYTVDYACERTNVVLLREGIQRGRVWRVNAAPWRRSTGYTFLGHQPARRVYFGTLPTPMMRQNTLANQAYNAAARIIRQRSPKAHLDLVWVRLTLPRADWAYVIFTPADASYRGWFALLHRVNGSWADASARRPYCTSLPKQVRKQLFVDKKSRNFHPQGFLAPRGETRC